jgi:hypothetical protein
MRSSLTLVALFSLATAAAAAPWTDPTASITLEAPAGWSVTAYPTDGLTYAVAASASSACHIVRAPRAETAERTAYHIRVAAEAPITPASWDRVVRTFPDLFPGAVTLQSPTVETEQFWPIQRATFTVAGAPQVYAAIQFRPGLELWAVCRTSIGASDTAAFDALFRSIGTPEDPALEAQAIEQQIAADEHARATREFDINERPPEHHYRGPDAGIMTPAGSRP